MPETTLQPGWLPWPTREGWWWMKNARGECLAGSLHGDIAWICGAPFTKHELEGYQFFPVALPPEGLRIGKTWDNRFHISVAYTDLFESNKKLHLSRYTPEPLSVADARALASAILLAAELIEQQGAK